MDEPTSALNNAEIAELFKIIRDLKAAGVGIIYISHKMDELKQISDRVTVLRDGEYVGTVPTETTSIETIISMMVGRTLKDVARDTTRKPREEVALEVKGLNRGALVKRRQLLARARRNPRVRRADGARAARKWRAPCSAPTAPNPARYGCAGKKVSVHSPSARRRGRHRLSVGGPQTLRPRRRMSVAANVMMASLARFSRCTSSCASARSAPRRRSSSSCSASARPRLTQETRLLSGGNQQKVVVAKWLARDCDILFFDEPTRGIDVGAKAEIYKLLQALADQGKAIVMISSELPEILRMSDRIVVMCEGRITGELMPEEATQERIMQLATQRETMAA